MEKGYKYYVICDDQEAKKEFANYLLEKGFIQDGDITSETPTTVLVVKGGYPPSFSEKKDRAGVLWLSGFHPKMYRVHEFKDIMERLKPVSLDALLKNHADSINDYVDIVVEDNKTFVKYCKNNGINDVKISSGIIRIHLNKTMENVNESKCYFYFNDLLDGKIIPYIKQNNKTYMCLDYVQTFFYRNIKNDNASRRIYEVHNSI